MSIDQPEHPVADGVRSLEVRWIFPGGLDDAVAEWFARFPAETQSREDTYLLDPHLPGLSVKLRGNWGLEVKVYRGSPGLLEVAGRPCGRLEFWQKWSFPCDPPRLGSGGPAGWRTVRKRRRISQFSPATGPAKGHGPRPGSALGCEVELTEIGVHGQAWWSLGFESVGPASQLHSELEAAAAVVFAQALPGGVELGMGHSTSYQEWLRRGQG